MRLTVIIAARLVVAITTPWSAVAQKPVIDSRGVMNSAVLVPPPASPGFMPCSGAPEGSIATIFGRNLAPRTASASEVPLPTSLAGVSVLASGGPQTAPTPVPLFYVSPGQINFQVPNNAAGQYYYVAVQTPGGVSDQLPLGGLATSCPGVFTQDASGCGPAWIFNVAADGTWSVNSPDNSVEPGGIVVILGTGWGPAGVPDGQPSPANPPAGSRFPNTWRIDVPTDGPPVGENALYIGRAPGLVGVDQYNFKLPDNAMEGCGIPATIRSTFHSAPGVWDSQPVPIHIHRGGGKCPALPAPQSYANLTLLKTTMIDRGSTSTTEQLNVTLSSAVGKSVYPPAWPPTLDPPGCLCATVAPDGWVFGPSCPFPAFTDRPVPVGPLTISGPGLSLSYTPQPDETSFQVLLSDGSLLPGMFIMSAPGGGGAGAFSVAVPVMQDIQFDNPAPSFFIDSNKVFTFRWTGGQDDEVVHMRLRNKDSWYYCECAAKATGDNRSFTIEPGIGTPFHHIAASPNGELTISVESSPPSVPFTAPGLTLGGAARWKRVWYYPNVQLAPTRP